MTDAQTVQKIEWLQQSFVVEYPELKENLSNLSIDTSDTVFIKSQITVSGKKCFINKFSN